MRLRRCLTRGLRGIQILHIPDLHHAVHDHLRRFFVANGNAAIQDNRRVFIKQRAILAQDRGECQKLHGTGIVLHCDIGHHGAGARGLHLDRLDDSGNVHDLLVLIGIAAVFKAFQNLTDWNHIHAAQQRPVLVHRMAGQIQTGRLLFQTHFLLHAHFRDIRCLHSWHGSGAVFAGQQIEQTHLAVDILILLAGRCVEHKLIDTQHLGAVQSKAVAGTGLDEIFQRPLVEIRSVHTGGKILKAGELPALLSLVHDLLDKAASDILDRRQAKADAARHDGEIVVGFIDIRRQQRNAHRAALGNILGDLDRASQHRRHERRHIFARVIAFEPRGLVRDHRVADGMRLVERVVRKVVHLVVDGFRRLLRNAVCDAAGDIARGVAPDKGAALLFDVLDLLFAHGAAHHVRLAKRISGKLPENLNDLLLIENAAVGDGKDRFQHGMLVFDKRWVLLAGDQTRDRLHRAGAVGCDDNGKIFD